MVTLSLLTLELCVEAACVGAGGGAGVSTCGAAGSLLAVSAAALIVY